MNENGQPVYVIETCERTTVTTQQRHESIVKKLGPANARSDWIIIVIIIIMNTYDNNNNNTAGPLRAQAVLGQQLLC